MSHMSNNWSRLAEEQKSRRGYRPGTASVEKIISTSVLMVAAMTIYGLACLLPMLLHAILQELGLYFVPAPSL